MTNGSMAPRKCPACYYHRDGEAVSTWLADIECHQKSSAFKYIPSEQWRISEEGAKQGCTREGARGKTGGSI